MNATTVKRIPEHCIGQARAVPIVPLAKSLTPLRQEASQEWSGPCPKCGGDDRFHVSEEGWFNCRQCHSKRGDVVELTQWLHGHTFPQAVEKLTSGGIHLPAQPQAARQSTQRPQVSQDEWRRKAEPILRRAQALLFEPEGAPAQEYLLGRELEPQTWLQFGLGYRPDVPLPGTKGQQRAPAIVIPWFAGTKLVGLRYRFLEVQHYADTEGKERTEKQTAEAGSQFSGRLFGGQGLFGGLERLRWLLIVEGELNAMCCWQVAYETGLDVLSIGSEGATLPPKVIELAAQYRGVLVWADKEEVAQRLMKVIPSATGIKSPSGRDANDLLQEGLLGYLLAGKRTENARHDDDREALLWGLYDAAMLPKGIDAGSAAVLRGLANRLGKKAEIHEAEPDRWITSWLSSYP